VFTVQTLSSRRVWIPEPANSYTIIEELQWDQSPKGIAPEKNLLIRLCRKVIPVTHAVTGKHFFLHKDGRLFATPLFLALLFLEMTDVLFAIDSVPAIFALTDEPLIVFTSNIFAILGLRAMYFLLAGAVDKFHLLKYGLAIVLIFVGLKMVWLNNMYEGKFPISLSLSVICGIIAISVTLSLLFPRPPVASRTPPLPPVDAPDKRHVVDTTQAEQTTKRAIVRGHGTPDKRG
jgi:tellurite resistance protein TerC